MKRRNYERLFLAALALSTAFHLLGAFLPQEALVLVSGRPDKPPYRPVRLELVTLSPEPAPVYRERNEWERPRTVYKTVAPVLPRLRRTSHEPAFIAGLAFFNQDLEPSSAETGPGQPVAALSSPAPDSSAVIRSYIVEVYDRIRRARHYPEISRRLGQEGEVEVAFDIGKDGCLKGATRLVHPSPFTLLDSAACRSIRRCEPFPPLPVCLQSKPFALRVKILYRLDE